MRDFRSLLAWQRSHQMVLGIYCLTKGMPRSERFGLTNQLRRAAAAVPTNIAEGCGHISQREFARFLQISVASASEAEYLLLLCRDLGYLAADACNHLIGQLIEIKKMLMTLIRRARGG